MNIDPQNWDYLIVTASNKTQAKSYETQLMLRHKLGLLSGIDQVLVVDDPQGKRIGSGGSTIFALLEVLSREQQISGLEELSAESIEDTLASLRILIIHAGGDSRRLPAYGPCGKIFIPIPGQSDSALWLTIFDRQFPIYRKLPPPATGQGQVVVTTGDVLLFFSPDRVTFRGRGVTGLGCFISPEMAKNHGVFCAGRDGEVLHFLQKPSVSKQKEKGAITSLGKSLLDIGVMELDARSATKLITLCNIAKHGDKFLWTGPIADEILSTGLDFYREICCAMGKKTGFEDFLKSVRESGCQLSEPFLMTLFDTVSKIPFHVHALEECTFLHFGTPRQLIETGMELAEKEQGKGKNGTLLSINNHISEGGSISGKESWVEGCRIRAQLNLSENNVVVGVDEDDDLSLPEKICLDIIEGHDRSGKKVWFVRIYGLDDSFKAPLEQESLIVIRFFSEWMECMGVSQQELWDTDLSTSEKNLWSARIFPAVSSPNDFHEWLWMSDPSQASKDQIQSWRRADKYSLAEISGCVNLEVFSDRRKKNRMETIRGAFGQMFDQKSRFSAADLGHIFAGLDQEQRIDWISGIMMAIRRHTGFALSRLVHTAGSALKASLSGEEKAWNQCLQSVYENLDENEKKELISIGFVPSSFEKARTWSIKARDVAFDNLSRTIVWSKKSRQKHPRCAVHADEIIWGQAPARLDLGGGWTDTPPYALEHGGSVINAAVNLEGKPPIHVHARILEDPVIRIISADHESEVIVQNLKELKDYGKADSKFGLAKAALVLSGFSIETASWPNGIKTLESMLECFGGGIELKTSAAIPSGSGLGTSSIMGAVLISVINRLTGKDTSRRELFNRVLQLEQELTTGGGWQDQIGGTIGGVKMISTEPGLVPDPKIRPVRSDLLDPEINQGQTLLYYTGMRRLAKNILRNIVGHYLDRDRATMEVLQKLHVFPPYLVDAMESVDMERFGNLVDSALRLKKEIDPGSSNPEMEKILERLKPYMNGATFLGAGGGGFLLVVCKSPEDALMAKKKLETDPPNPEARFFDYSISTTGLEVSVG